MHAFLSTAGYDGVIWWASNESYDQMDQGGQGRRRAVGIWGDVLTIKDPPQAGLAGNVDALGFSLPPVGVAAAVGTGFYVAGAHAYKHWAFFRNDIAKPIGHAVVDVARGIGHGVAAVGHAVAHGVSDVAHDVASWF